MNNDESNKPDNYAQLSNAEIELLSMLIEELGEAIQAATKVLRHGWVATDHVPKVHKKYDNKQLLINELNEISAIVYAMWMKGIIHEDMFEADPNKIWNKKIPHTHHQFDDKKGE